MTDHELSVEISDWGPTLAKAVDDEGMEHHWWCDETDSGRVVAMAEVIHHDDGRHYVPKSEVTMPDAVMAAVAEYHNVEEDEVYSVGQFE